MSTRQFLISIGVIVLVIIVGVGLYFVFFAGKSPTTATTQTGQTGTLPSTGDQTIQTASGTSGLNGGNSNTLGTSFGVIANQAVLDYFVNNQNTVTAVEPNGEIIQVSGGQISTISSLMIQNIINASFSYDGEKILVNFGDPSNPQTSVFDVTKKTWSALSSGFISPAWSPSNYQIVYRINNANGTELFATIDTSSAKPTPSVVLTLHAQDLSVAWPYKNDLVLYTKPSASTAGSAWAFNLQSQTLNPIDIEVPGLEILWSSNEFFSTSTMGLEFSSGASGYGGSAMLTDISGGSGQALKFITLPTKCLFATATSSAITVASSTAVASTTNTAVATTTSASQYLYCGVPRDQNALSLAQLPDNYNQMALYTSDDIYRINLQTGEIDTVFNDQTQNVDVSDVKLFNDTLFFINRYNSELYAIQFSQSVN